AVYVCASVPEWMTIAASKAAVRQTVAVTSYSRPATEPDAELREYLREWRRNTAKEQGMPAYVVLHDTTLEEICRIRPSSIPELRRITGIGERKAELYGQQILGLLQRYRE